MSLIVYQCRSTTNLSDLSLVVVDELGRNPLGTFGHQDVPDISPLALDLLETPDLVGDPTIINALCDALDELAVGLDEPALLEKVVLDLVESDESGTALDRTE